MTRRGSMRGDRRVNGKIRHAGRAAIEALEMRTLLSADTNPNAIRLNSMLQHALETGGKWRNVTGFNGTPQRDSNIEPPPPPEALAPALTSSIEGINFDENAANVGNYFIPADPSGAVGPNHVVSVVNSSIEWHTKTGTQQQSVKLGTSGFFAPLSPTTATFDPKVVYDQYNNRFVVVTLEKTSSTSRILVAVSDDSDPNGTWFYQAFNGKLNIGGIDRWFDYPGLAVDSSAIYLTGNMFSLSDNAYAGSRLWIISKASLYSGGTSSFAVYDPSTLAGLPGQAFTLQPAHMFGTAQAGVGTFLVNGGWVSGTTDFLSVIRIDNPLSSPTFSNQFLNLGDVDNTSVAFPDAPQLGTSVKIETNDGRMLNAVWRNNALWATNTVRPPSGVDVGEATARWYKINTSTLSTLTLADTGNVGGDSDIAADTHTFMPSVMVDAAGNMAMNFSASSATTRVGAYYTLRLAADAAGTTQPAGVFAQGQDYYIRTFGGASNRWGDYTGIGLDPADSATFWVFNKYALTRGTLFSGEDGRWGTKWGAFSATGAPANDMFAGRFALSGRNVTTAGSNINGTKESSEPNHASNAGGKSVWWSWTAPSSNSYVITTAGSSFNTLLGVYTGSAVNALTTIASNNDESNPSILTSRVVFNAVAGTTYQIAVDGSGGASGAVALAISPALHTISGNVFMDRNSDGIQNGTDFALSGRTVFIDGNNNGVLDSASGSISSSDVPKSGIDNTTVTSNLVVGGRAGLVTDVNVTLSISHTWDEDLDVFLISPSGTRVELFTDVGGNGDNFTNTTLDDEAATAITAGSPPFTGTYRPEGLLSTIDGEDPNGTWKLEITDDEAGDAGTLTSWSIFLSTAEISTTTNASGAYSLSNLLSGTYNLRLVSTAGQLQTTPTSGAALSVAVSLGAAATGRNFGNFPTTFTGSAGADTYTLTAISSGATLQIVEALSASASVTWSIPKSLLASTLLTFDGAAGNDVFNIDHLSGSPVPGGAITVNGGANTDTLNILGATTADTATFNAASISLGGTTNFSGIESVTFHGRGGMDALSITGGSVTFPETQRFQSLSLSGTATATLASGASRFIRTSALSMASSTILNLGDNDLILDYTGASPLGSFNSVTEEYNGVQGLIASALNEGDWLGFGIRTAGADAVAGRTTLGSAEASYAFFISGSETALFGTETVDATTVLVKYTWNGDADLSGVIDADDYSHIDTNVRSAGAHNYSYGDFNYDGRIDADDYSWIDVMYRQQTGQL